MIFEEKKIKSEMIYEGKIMTVRRDTVIDSNENEEKNIQNLNEIPPKDHLKTIKNHLKTIHR